MFQWFKNNQFRVFDITNAMMSSSIRENKNINFDQACKNRLFFRYQNF